MIWQWNCRGFKKKKALLQQHILNQGEPPLAVALQETGKPPIKISGYRTFDNGRGENCRVATLVKNNIAVIEHDVSTDEVEAVLVEILTGKKNRGSIFVLNAYSPPRHKKAQFETAIKKALRAAKSCPLLVLGDFNAKHHEWGYTKIDRKGRMLWEAIQKTGLSLLTDPNEPTRTGNSICCDTTPDLTLGHRTGKTSWKNTGENLGSDHFIIEIQIDRKLGVPVHKPKQATATDWDKFRDIRSTADLGEIGDITEWTSTVVSHVKQATETVQGEDLPFRLDNKLRNMWNRKTTLENKLKRQKWNRNLRKKIAEHNKEIESYAFKLEEKRWDQKCDELEKNMSRPNTWQMLRHLIDPTNTKTHANIEQIKARYKFDGTDEQLIDRLKEIYIGPACAAADKEYQGAENPLLDESILVAEVRAALFDIKKNTAPGPDKITYGMLRNLDDDSIVHLTAYLNKVWESGEVPKDWKHANIILIHKKGKIPGIENLRPISLTSCLGKLMEKVIQKRLSRFAEENSIWPHEMVGFRPHLSAQDTMLRLQHDIIDKRKTKDTRAILGIDLTKAFDNVSHSAILDGLSDVNVGQRTFDYIKSFLKDRTATLHMQSLSSEEIKLGNRGTPQGAILSPFLFNLVMKDLPRKLGKIEGLKTSVYADDVNVWLNEGSDASIEERLQRAADIIDFHAKSKGLSCSPTKSELLLIRPRTRTDNASPPRISIDLDGKEIPQVDEIRILGMLISKTGNNHTTIAKLDVHANQVVSIVRRISARGRGLKEKNKLRLVQAFILSRICYSTPFLNIKKAERNKLDVIIRKCTKRALGLPISTSTEALEGMGVHNTWQELAEATRTAQLERLSLSETGQQILNWVGLQANRGTKYQTFHIESKIRKALTVAPIPKNMHPQHDQERRQHRAKHLTTKLSRMPPEMVAFTDAALGGDGSSVSVVVDGSGVEQGAIYTSGVDATAAEEAAIALACVSTDARVIVSDSKSAVRNFCRGKISDYAYSIISKGHIDRGITITWAPAHCNITGNEAANALARALIIRGGRRPQPNFKVEVLVTYHEITEHYRLGRRKYPLPDRSLTSAEAVTWRRLQAKNHMSPRWRYLTQTGNPEDQFCRFCDKIGTLRHILWECSYSPGYNLFTDEQAWETALHSEDPAAQANIVRLAAEAASRFVY